MKYKILLEPSDEGYAASVPGLPGCHSQGSTEPEALANITEAIKEYLAVVEELTRGSLTREVEIEV
jgi:predicted RNase H-like HicB family nuclease